MHRWKHFPYWDNLFPHSTFFLEKLFNSDLKRKSKWVQVIFTFKLHKEGPINFFAKLGVSFPPCLLCKHTCSFTSPRCCHPSGSTTSRRTAQLIVQSPEGKGFTVKLSRALTDTFVWYTLPVCISWQFDPLHFLVLLFHHIQILNNFLIWCIIVQYMNFPHIVKIIMLTLNTHTLHQCLLLSEQSDM